MFRLPPGLTWPMVIVSLVVIAGGFWAGDKVSERRRLLTNLENHAKTYPGDADVVAVLVSCNKRIVVDVEGCSAQLLMRFGEDVIPRMARMQEQGAFGRPLGPDGQPVIN